MANDATKLPDHDDFDGSCKSSTRYTTVGTLIPKNSDPEPPKGVIVKNTGRVIPPFKVAGGARRRIMETLQCVRLHYIVIE